VACRSGTVWHQALSICSFSIATIIAVMVSCIERVLILGTKYGVKFHRVLEKLIPIGGSLRTKDS